MNTNNIKIENLEYLIKIPEDEDVKFSKMIRDYRKKHVSSNDIIVERVVNRKVIYINNVLINKNVSQAIHRLRELVYEEFLLEEAKFNSIIIKDICEMIETPSNIMSSLISNIDFENSTKLSLIEQIKIICGEYAGRICPYIYKLSLSNTNSRRSRAGKTFELIIYKMYELFNYEYVSQGQIGKSTFQEHGLGKMVDSLLPNIEAFEQRRDKVIIGTMKTTLRERWQEVIEEMNRAGLPHIYLLTMDDNISKNKAIQMGKHNVLLVVPKNVKNTPKLQDMKNIVSFEDYFLEEIPDKIKYWKD